MSDKGLKTLAQVAAIEHEALEDLSHQYGFHGKMDDTCVEFCKKRIRAVVKECISIALLDADKKKQSAIVQTEQMPLVRKRMRICAWKEDTLEEA